MTFWFYLQTIFIADGSLWPVKGPLLIEWIANFICICVGSLMVKIFVCSVLSYLYLTKSCCFTNITSNRVTALFYRPRRSSETVQTSMWSLFLLFPSSLSLFYMNATIHESTIKCYKHQPLTSLVSNSFLIIEV